MSILAIRLGGLGDLLAVLPSLNLLRRAFPGRRIVLRGRADQASLLLERGVVDQVRPVGAREPNAEAFDLRIGWFQKGSSVPGPPGRYFVFDPGAATTVGRFFFEKTAGVLRESGAGSNPDFDACARLPGARPVSRNGPAVIHPGSGSVRKRWPLDRFLALAAELARGGTAGRIVTGEAEAGITARLRDTALPPGWEFLDSPPLAVLAALLESAPVYVGNDSGVTHLAAACGAPVVALFRSEFAVHWRPSGGAIVLASDEVDGILLDAAFRAVAEVAASGSGNPCAMIGRNEGER